MEQKTDVEVRPFPFTCHSNTNY